MTSYSINNVLLLYELQKKKYNILPEPTGMNSPVASIMNVDWAKSNQILYLNT